jgi:hypothetical protein
MTDRRVPVETRVVTVKVPIYAPDRGLPRLWPDRYALKVEMHERYVSIVGDASGLRGLAVQLLALAEDGVPAGYADDLDDLGELDIDSIQLTIIRR